jgi:DNA-binding transcriptional LysR family regulator
MNGELDCVVGRLSPAWAMSLTGSQQVVQVALVEEPRCIVCRAGHPLGRRAAPSLEVLAGQGWILQPPPSSTRLLFDELFLDRGMSPPVAVVESASVHSNISMAAATDLLAVVPLPLAQRLIAKGELQRLSAKVELTRMSVSAIWRRTADLDPLLVRLRDALVTACRERHAP